MKSKALIVLLCVAVPIVAAIFTIYLFSSDVSDAPSGVAEQLASPEVQAGNATRETVTRGDVTVREPSFSKPMEEEGNSQGWLFFSLSVMAIVTLTAVAISFYLYRWRRILLNNPHLVVPEELGGWLNNLSKNIDDLSKYIDSGIRHIDHQGQETHQSVKDLSETFMTMQRALDEREEEIRRLKRGHDAHIYRKFVYRFIGVDQAVEDFYRDGGADQAGLEQIRRLFEDAFAECGVECFKPEIGEDYREADGIADKPKTVKSDRPEDAFKVAEVLENGYLIRGAEGAEVIIPARVKIYTFQEEEGVAV